MPVKSCFWESPLLHTSQINDFPCCESVSPFPKMFCKEVFFCVLRTLKIVKSLFLRLWIFESVINRNKLMYHVSKSIKMEIKKKDIVMKN